MLGSLPMRAALFREFSGAVTVEDLPRELPAMELFGGVGGGDLGHRGATFGRRGRGAMTGPG